MESGEKSKALKSEKTLSLCEREQRFFTIIFLQKRHDPEKQVVSF